MQLLQKGFNIIRLIVTLRDKISHLSEYKVLGRNALWCGCGSSTVVYVLLILEWSFLSLDIWMNTRKMSFSRVKTLIYYSRSCFLDISVDLFFFSRGLLYEPVGMSVQRHTRCRQGRFLWLFSLPGWVLLAGESAWNKLPQSVRREWARGNPGTQVLMGLWDEGSLKGKSILEQKYTQRPECWGLLDVTTVHFQHLYVDLSYYCVLF